MARFKRIGKVLIVFALLFLLAGGLLVLRPSAASVSAEGGSFSSGTGTSPTLQEALSAGTDTVYVFSGADLPLSSTVVITRDVVIAGSREDFSPAPAVLCRAPGFRGSFFRVEKGATLTLKDITLDGGGEADSPLIECAGGLRLLTGACLKNNHNSVTESGAVHVSGEGAFAEAVGGVITGNRAAVGGILAENGATVTLKDDEDFSTEISANPSSRGALVADGGSLSIEGGRISETEGYAVCLFGEGGLSFSGKPLVLGTVYLDDGAVADFTRYRNGVIDVAVSETRGDGAIARRTPRTGDPAWSEILSVEEPAVIPDGYLEGYQFVARYSRITLAEGTEEYGYGGFGINISQETYGKLIFYASFTDRAECSVTLGGQTAAFAGDPLRAEFGLREIVAPIAGWSVKVGDVVKEFGPVGLVYVYEDSGECSAPAGSEYVAEGGERKPLPSGRTLLPNDLAIEEGVAQFFFDGYFRKVFVGYRVEAVDPAEAAGQIYDAENTEAFGVVIRFLGSEEYEYALLKEGELAAGWTSPREGKVVFTSLAEGTSYALAARRPAVGYNLPSAYVLLGVDATTLTNEESNRRYAFYNAYYGLLEGETVKAEIRGGALNGAFSVYTALKADYPRVAAFPALLEWLEAMKAALPAALANDWRADHADLLALDEQTLSDVTRGAYREPAGTAAKKYYAMDETAAALLGGNAEAAGIDVQAAASAARQLLLEEMLGNVMPKVRKIAALDIEAADLKAENENGLDAEQNSEAVARLHAIRDEYKGLVEAQGEADALDEIYRLVSVASVKLGVRGYGERLLIEKADENFSKEEFSDAFTSVMDGLSSLSENFSEAQYRAEFSLFCAYGELALTGLFGQVLPESLLEELYRGELDRLGKVELESADGEGLEAAEAAVGRILKEAGSKRELQLYFEELTVREEGLSLSDLSEGIQNAAVRGELKEGFAAIDEAGDDGMRAEAVSDGKLSLYRALAAELLREYAEREFPALSERLSALYEAECGKLLAAATEQETERICAGGGLKLLAAYFYEGIKDALPEEQALQAVFGGIDQADADPFGEMVAAKTAAAYGGMLGLYRTHAGLVLDGYGETFAQVEGQAALIEGERTAIGEVALGSNTPAALQEATASIDAHLANAHEKLGLQAYFEGLSAAEDVLAALRGPLYLSMEEIEACPSAEEKREAGFEGKRDLNAKYLSALLRAHLSDTYPETAGSLTALAEEAEARISSVGYGGDYTEARLRAIEKETLAIKDSAVWKMALQAFFEELTGAGGVAEPYREALEDDRLASLAAVDEAAMSETEPYDSLKKQEAYRGMLGLYGRYAEQAVKALEKEYLPLSERLSKIILNAETELGKIAEEGDPAEQLSALCEKIDGVLADTAAELGLTAAYEKYDLLRDPSNLSSLEQKFRALTEEIRGAEIGEKEEKAAAAQKTLFGLYAELFYGEFTARYPVSAADLAEVTEGDLEEAEAASAEFGGLTEALKAAFSARVPSYENQLGVEPFALSLFDRVRKAQFEAARAETLSAVFALYGDYPAEGELAEQLSGVRTSYGEALRAVGYAAYSASGENADPSQEGYLGRLLAELGALQAKAADAAEDKIALFEIGRFSNGLEEELGGFLSSRLKDVEKEKIRASFKAAEEKIRAQVSSDESESLTHAREGLLEMRNAFAETALSLYAALFGEEADFAAVRNAGTDEEKTEAMFRSLLDLYRAHALTLCADYPAFAEGTRAHISAVLLGEFSDAGLFSAEQEIEGWLVSADRKTELSAFFGELSATYDFSEELDQTFQTALGGIDSAPLAQKDEATARAKKDLAKCALTLFAASLPLRGGEGDVGLQAALEAVESADADTMSETILSEEKEILIKYVNLYVALYLPEADDGLSRKIKTALGGVGGELAQAIGGAATLLSSKALADEALHGAAVLVLDAYFEELSKELDPENAAALKEVRDGLAAQADLFAHTAVRALFEGFGRILLEDARLDLGGLADYRDGVLEELSGLAQGGSEAREADHLVQTLPRIVALCGQALCHIEGENLFARSALTKAYGDIAASDLEPLRALLGSLGLLSEGTRRYLDEVRRGEYPTFEARLTDACEKAEFEALRKSTIGEIGEISCSGELAEARKEEGLARAAALEYLSALEREEEDSFGSRAAQLNDILLKTRVGVTVADLQDSLLQELYAEYMAMASDPQVRYGENLSALQAAYENAEKAVRAVEGEGKDYETAVQSAEEGLARAAGDAREALASVPVFAVAKGVNANGEGHYASEDDLWGILECEEGFPAATSFELRMLEDTPARTLVDGKVLKAAIEIVVSQAEEGTYRVKILLPSRLLKAAGLQVAAVGAEGTELLQTSREGEFLVFETTHFSVFYLYGEAEYNLWWLIGVLTAVLICELIAILYLSSKLYRKLDRAASFGGAALLAVLIPGGAAVVSIVLGTLVVIAGVVIFGLLRALSKKTSADTEKTERSEEPAAEAETVAEPAEEIEETVEATEEPVAEAEATEAAEETEEPEEGEQLSIFDLPAAETPEGAEADEADEEGPEQLSIFDVREEPAETVEEEPAVIEEEPAEAVIEEEPVVIEEEPEIEDPEPVAVVVVESEPEAEEPAEAVIEEEPAEAVIEEEPVVIEEEPEAVIEEEPEIEDPEPVAVVVIESEPEAEEPAEAVIEEEPAETAVEDQPVVIEEEPAETAVEDEPAVIEEEPAEAVIKEEPAPVEIEEEPEAVIEEEPEIEDPEPVSVTVVEPEPEELFPIEEEEKVSAESDFEAPMSEDVPSESAENVCAEGADEMANEAESETEKEGASEEEPVFDFEEEPIFDPAPVPVCTIPEDPQEFPEVPESVSAAEERAQESAEELIEEPAQEPAQEPVEALETPETPAEAPSPEAETAESKAPEDAVIPPEEFREEVAASEVNALMQDSVARTFIEESSRVAVRGKTGIINVDTLGQYFESGERVTLEEIKRRVPFFPKKATFVKILARGSLSKALIVEGDDFSLEAVKMIVLTGGHVIRTRRASQG